MFCHYMYVDYVILNCYSQLFNADLVILNPQPTIWNPFPQSPKLSGSITVMKLQNVKLHINAIDLHGILYMLA